MNYFKHFCAISLAVLFMYFLALQNSLAAEIKLGILRSPQKHEKGENVNFEYIGGIFSEKYNAAPIFGVSKNLTGCTSSFYTGIFFKKVLADFFLIEGSLGVAIHDGPLNKKEALQKHGRVFGSRLLFRESFGLGFVFQNQNNISLFIDHISNANLAPPNHGLTNLGIRYGIVF